MTNPDNVGGLVWYVCTSCLLMVQLPSDTPTLGRCQCSPKGWSLRRVKLPNGYELRKPPLICATLVEAATCLRNCNDELSTQGRYSERIERAAVGLESYSELCRAAPAGGDAEWGKVDPSWSLFDRVDFALRDAGFDLDEASDIAALAAAQESALAGAHTASGNAGPVRVDGEMFICYLIEKCERETIYEESLHEWLADFLKNPRYHKPSQPGRKFRGVGELERTGYIPAGSADERDARDEQEYDDEQCFPEHEVEAMKLEAVQDSAPAGSGEVEDIAASLEQMTKFVWRLHEETLPEDCTIVLRGAADLLRKLQHGADGCHRILFSGEVMRETDEIVTDEGQWSNVRPPFIGMRYQNHMRTVRRAASQDQEGGNG